MYILINTIQELNYSIWSTSVLSFHSGLVTAILWWWYNGGIGGMLRRKITLWNPFKSSLVRYTACSYIGTANTSSNSSNVNPLVSGKNHNTKKNPMTFHAAYQPKAPVGVNAFCNRGHVNANIKLKNQQVAVAQLIPKSRMYNGNASAEYVNGTGPSELEYIAEKM
ncbi:uncharacterized protein CAALFM_C300230CA [Candida albicans SC5314]|uniref:Uncharacterized protein n=1 Tax=Candida albicans (strain SC5314 / ATCC MYA-2876) TaxID=237561 RepID=Q5A7M0_CANAL|nr:uncharacterized protein CAALFM_C300230CA [Candida albicans SC5314]AOW28073.1 hypothetical protein CAALFM_C300230CA [Candida albicans SC5314]|eukprot:XP_717818.1 hypothetical protein CAALFM_C300230CA [Candida albicans SC5314]